MVIVKSGLVVADNQAPQFTHRAFLSLGRRWRLRLRLCGLGGRAVAIAGAGVATGGGVAVIAGDGLTSGSIRSSAGSALARGLSPAWLYAANSSRQVPGSRRGTGTRNRPAADALGNPSSIRRSTPSSRRVAYNTNPLISWPACSNSITAGVGDVCAWNDVANERQERRERDQDRRARWSHEGLAPPAASCLTAVGQNSWRWPASESPGCCTE